MPPEIPSPEQPEPAAAPPGRAWGEWRGLVLFWAVVLGGLAVGGVTLQVLGPPAGRLAPRPAVPAGAAAGAAAPGTAALDTATPGAPAGTQLAGAPPRPVMAGRPGRATPGPTGGPIAAPDPALLEPAPGDGPAASLPRIAADGRAPMQVYAAGFDPATKAARIAVLVAGIGLDEAASEEAIRVLPAAVTLAVSPYTATPDVVAAAARRAGHEYLISIPLEPAGYALNDPGPRALLTGASPAENALRLDWVLSRLAGYVGATGALGDMRGERFADVPEQMDPMLATLAARGLLYVDPRQGKAGLAQVWSRAVDVVIDDPPDAASIDARFAALEQRARDTGAALGLIGAIRPVTLAHLVAWVGKLAGRGFALAPVSAVVMAPEGVTSEDTASGGAMPGGVPAEGVASRSAPSGGAPSGSVTPGSVPPGSVPPAGATSGGTTPVGTLPGGKAPQ